MGAPNVREFQLGTKRTRAQGTRIAAVRFLQRYMSPARSLREWDADAWLPQLAPSRRLIDQSKNKDESEWWQWFKVKYESEVLRSPDNKRLIIALARISKRSPISIGCYCDTGRHKTGCHRFVLERLIRRAAAGKLD